MKDNNSSKKINISLISANYNNGKFLGDFFDSIEKSSILPDEVLIVDDNSTDGSAHILSNYAGKLNLIPIFCKEHIGFAEALNMAVKKSSGKYLLRLDPDDLIHPMRIEKQLIYLQANPEVDLIGSNVKYFRLHRNRTVFQSNVPLNESAIKKSVNQGNIPVIHSSILGKREIFLQQPYQTFLLAVEDYHFLANLVKKQIRLVNIPECLTWVRIHSGSVSDNLLIERTRTIFHIREEVFGFKPNSLLVLKNFYQIRFYRKFLSGKSLFRWMYLLLAGLLGPGRVLKRIIRR